MIDYKNKIISINNSNFVYDLLTNSITSSLQDYKFRKFYRTKYIEKLSRELNKNRVIDTIDLVPTWRCKGDCIYCYNKQKNNTTDNEVNIQQIKNILYNYDFNIKVIMMYGGEPLLHSRIDELLDDLINEFNPKIIYISTGLLFPNKYFEIIFSKLQSFKSRIKIGISLDLGTINKNYTRVNNFGLNKYDLITRAIELYQDNFNIQLNSAINKFSNVKEFINDISFINNKIKIGAPDYINNKNILYRIQVIQDKNYSPDINTIYSFYNYIINNHNKIGITSNIFPNLNILDESVILKNESMYYLMTMLPNCGYSTSNISISPEGVINCHLAPDKLKSKYKLYSNRCLYCPLFLLCRGGCPVRRNYIKYYLNCYWTWLSADLLFNRPGLLRKIEAVIK